MREIEYKAWNKLDKKMVDLAAITPLALSDSMNTQLALKGMSGLFFPFSKDIELLEYTTKKDKNGKKIYEGGIIRYVVDGMEGAKYTYVGVVMWNEDWACWDIVSDRIHEFDWVKIERNGIELIGTIQENPELVKP